MVARSPLLALTSVLLFALAPRSFASPVNRGGITSDGGTPATVTAWHNPLGVTTGRSLSPAAGRTIIIPTAWDDFASGNQLTTVGGTAEVNLDPGSAGGNAYTVHYFVSVTIDASSTYGTMSLVVAIETNSGSGWVERGTYAHDCSYLSGPPPYSARTCSFSHEQRTITVAGLGLNADIRLKAKSFSYVGPNAHTGSFKIRGGDAGGSNPETFSGVTYIQTTPARITQTGGYTDTFTVKNTGGSTAAYTLACSTSANISCVRVTPLQVSLAAGAQTTVVAAYDVGIAGTGTLRVLATSGSVTDTGTYSVPVNNPTAGAPIVDASPQYGHRAQSVSRCAANCFAATYAQSTVPYVSLDSPRNLTLSYNGDRANPKPFVHVNVRPDSTYGQWPTEYRLEVKVNGASVTFVNNETVLHFAYPGNTWARIGGQFNAASYGTGVQSMDILVTARYSGGSVFTNTWSTKLVVVNDSGSPIARGWTLAGIQRLYTQGDGSALVTGGDGSAIYFAKSGSVFVTPAGEFSELRSGTPSGGSGWTRAFPDSTKVVFDSIGRMTQVRDRFNNIATVVYDGSNRVSKVRDPINLPTTLTYGSNGLSTIQDTMGRVTNVTVDASRRLTAITDPDNVSTTFGYDGSLRLSTITNRGGKTTTLGYDAPSGKLATVTAPTITFVGANGTDSTGSPVTTLAAWQKVGVPYGSTSTPVAAPTTDTVYARVTDPGGHVTRFTVNQWGTPIEARDTLAQVTTVTFNPNGLPIRVVYPTGVRDTIAYNASGSPTYVRPAGRDSATFIRYAAWEQPDSTWGYQQSSVRLFVGLNGRVDSTRTWGPAGAGVTRFVYETRGRVERVTDGEGHLAGRTWYLGTNGSRSRDSLPGNRQTTYSYDSYGRSTSVSAPGVSVQFAAYDILNRVLKDSIAGVAPTVYAYDSLFLKTVTDAKGQVYRFAYNALGWTTAQTDPANRADTLRYNRDGLLVRWKNRRLQVAAYTYDAGHRPTLKTGANTDTTSWTYSADHRIISATSPWAVDTQFVSTAGRLDSVRTRLGGQTFTQRFRYTTAGRLDSVEVAGGGVAFLARKYVWDAQSGAVNTIRLGGGGTTALGTNRDGLLTSTTLPGGDAIGRAYTAVHAEAQISTGAPYAATVTRYLNFDGAGRVTRQIDGSGVAGRAFSYDGLGRLVADSQISYEGPTNPCEEPAIVDENGTLCTYEGTWSTVPSGSASFSYDSVGNRTDRSGEYGSANRIRQFASCTYVTDSLGDGNVLSRTCGSEVVRFWWTAESRLAALKVVGGDSLDFRYDASGRLVRKDVDTIPQAYFLWQGDNLLAELTGAATGKVAEYSYYPGLDNPHAVITGTTPHFAHVDGIGNVIALTDSAKNVKRDYDFDTWGGPRGGTDYKPFSNVDRARFKGALWLGPQVDVYYMRARWYETKSGRFLSEDPIGLRGGINQYAFAGSDPVNGRDPTGLQLVRIGNCTYNIVESEVTVAGVTTSEVAVYFLGCLAGGGGGGGGRGGGGGGSFGGGWGGWLGGAGPGQQGQAPGQAPYTRLATCPALNRNFVRQLNSELSRAQSERLERGGNYGTPWSAPVRMTATSRGLDWINIPLHPGVSGYWHTHQNPQTTHHQGPSIADRDWVVNVAQSPEIIRSVDSLFILHPDGRIEGCAP